MIKEKIVIKLRDLTGQMFGELLVVNRTANIKDRVAWNCICNCGIEVAVRGGDLTSGHTRTCGHIQNKLNGINTKEQSKFSNGRLVRIYHNMKQRCLNSNNRQYPDYGGRGIQISKVWLGENGLDNFYNWSMQNGYTDQLTIDRINVNKDYSPANCRWATAEVQSNNKRNSRYITINNERKTISQWEKELRMPTGALRTMISNDILNKKIIKKIYKISFDSTLKIELLV